VKCAIYGAGSLGTVLGAYLAESGADVELVNRNRAHVEALRKNGAVISGTVQKQVPVRAIFPEEMEGPYDILLLMTKQLNNRETVSFLKPLLAPDGVLVTLQNGLPEPGIAEIIGPERTMGCVVEWGATLIAPGCSRLTSDPEGLYFHMGRMPGVRDESFAAVRALLERMCPVAVENNLMGARWSKLLINATFSGVGTVMGGLFGDVSETPKARKIAIRCMKECIDTGRAAGVTFAPVQGKNITMLFSWHTPVKRFFGERILPIAMKKHRLIEPSMLQDLKKGKLCEVDAINGVICGYGRKLGIPTPINDQIVDIIHREERGELRLDPSNLDLITFR